MTTSLPPIDPPAPDDNLPGEAELTALYRQLPKSEPSPALDAAVLRAAEQALTRGENPLAVERRRRSQRERGDWVRPKDVPLRDIDSIGLAPRPSRRRPPSWLLALGSAASLVLVAGVAWHMRSQSTGITAASTANTASTASMSEPAVAMPTEASATSRQVEAVANAAGAKPPTFPRLATPPTKLAKPTMVARKAVPAAPDTRVRPASGRPLAQSHKPSPERDEAGNQPATTADRAAVAMPPPPPPVAEVSAPSTFAAPAPPLETLSAPVSTTPTRAEAPSDAQKATTAQLRELDGIRKLFADHRDEEAQRRLENFHRSYPRWELPEDLRAHLGKP